MRKFGQGLSLREQQYACSLLAIKDVGALLQRNYSRDVGASHEWLQNADRREFFAKSKDNVFANQGMIVGYRMEDAATSKGRLQNPHEAAAHFDRQFPRSDFGKRLASYPDRDVAREVENMARAAWNDEIAAQGKVHGFDASPFSGRYGVSVSELAMRVVSKVELVPVSSMMKTASAEEIEKTSKHMLAQKFILERAAEIHKGGMYAAALMNAKDVVDSNINALHAIHIVRACEAMLPALRELHSQGDKSVSADLIFKVRAISVAAAMGTHGDVHIAPHQFLERIVQMTNAEHAKGDLPQIALDDLKQAADLAQKFYPGVAEQFQPVADLQDCLGHLRVEMIERHHAQPENATIPMKDVLAASPESAPSETKQASSMSLGM